MARIAALFIEALAAFGADRVLTILARVGPLP
jgi:hypothetical protein